MAKLGLRRRTDKVEQAITAIKVSSQRHESSVTGGMENVAGPGIEPETFCLQGRRSYRLS